MSLRRFVSVLFLLCLFLTSQLVAQRPRPKTSRPAAKSATAGPSTVKAIFEPVNYGEDVNLLSVFFTGVDEGWASGAYGTILHTTNGGATWTSQLGGSPGSQELPISGLRFVDQHHGWAISQYPNGNPVAMLRTLDGEHWQRAGVLPGDFTDFQFSTPNNGVMLAGYARSPQGILRTNDGGMSWQKVVPAGACQVKLTVSGLARSVPCDFWFLQFVSPRIAYAIGQYQTGSLILAKTTDGGGTWTAWGNTDPTMNGDLQSSFFLDEMRGFVFLDNGQFYQTSDGGRTWNALVATVHTPGQFKFADPEIGWSVNFPCCGIAGTSVNFTANAGNTWREQKLPLPTHVNAFAFPRRDRAYLAGDHGMVYRYRVVPANYTAANMLPGPMMPAFGAMELSAKADTIRKDIESLRSKLPQESSDAAAAQSAPTSGAATSASSFTQSTDASVQDSASASGASTFVQDTTPAAGPVADCCAAALQQLQTDTFGLVTQVPAVTSQYRPLNLIFAGVQLAGTLMNQSKDLWSQFRALKHAPSLQAASQALQKLSTTLDTVKQTSSNGFQNPGGWLAANAPAAFTQDVGTGPAGAGEAMGNFTSGQAMQSQQQQQNGAAQNATPQSGQQTQSSSGTPNQQQNSAQDSVDQTVDKAKKIKNKLKWPPQ